MRKFILPILIILLLIPGYFIFEFSHPKTAGRFPFLVILLAVDVYLWFSIRKKVNNLPSLLKYTTIIAYWTPLALFVALTSISVFKNLNLLNSAFMTYTLGVNLVIYFTKLLIVVFFLLADLYRILFHVFRHARVKRTGKMRSSGKDAMSRGKFLRTMGMATGGLFFSGMLIGMVKWAHDFRVKYVNLQLPGLPINFHGLRIVQISDLHLGSWASANPIEEVADIIEDLDPDLVLFTGDLVNYSSPEAYKFRSALERIQSRHGVFAILGNHDYGDYVIWPDVSAKDRNMQQLYDFYEEIGWKLLRNENTVLNIDGEKLALIGVENWSSNPRFPKLGNLSEALKGTEAVPVKILLSHDPTHFEHEVSKNYPEIDLTLSGHTHGFQFGVDLKRFKWSFAQYVYKYWAGIYQVENVNKTQYLYVNRGLGTIGYPGRVGVLPEITLFTLES
jgi:uncharacterized protein